MNCPHCATELTEDCRYCPKCGASAASAPDLPAEEAPLPRDVHAQLTQANLCRAHGDFLSAVDHCVAVLRAQPGNQATHALLGDIYRDQGKVDDAIQWYRMAVDLQPNPADERKLRLMEQERHRRLRRAGAQSGHAKALLPPAGEPTSGTTNLMGMSPRRWLRGITATALAFAALVLIALIGMQISRRRENPVPHPVKDIALMPTHPGANSLLPPVRPGEGPISVDGQDGQSAPKPSVGGGGFGADHPSSSSLPTVPLNRTPGSARDSDLFPTPEVLPAPVTGIRPLNGASPNNGEQASPDTPASPESPENASGSGAGPEPSGQEPPSSTPPADPPHAPDTTR